MLCDPGQQSARSEAPVMIYVHAVIFFFSLVFLAVGSDFLVEYAARIAKRLNISDFLIGLTVTSVGTSIPELAASISATLEQHPGLVIGNICGSNIANIGLVLGIAALIVPMHSERYAFSRDAFFMIAGALLFYLFALDQTISRVEAVGLLVVYALYLFFIVTTEKEEKAREFRGFVQYVFNFEYLTPLLAQLYHLIRLRPKPERTRPERRVVRRMTMSFVKDALVLIAACIAVTIGARFLVQEAAWIANAIGVPESIIGLSLVAVGTSLPELTVSLSALRKGKAGIVLGNVMGSNIANILLIIGVSASMIPLHVALISLSFSIPVMILFCIGMIYFLRSGWRVRRWQGGIALIAYVIFIALAYIRGWS